MNNDCFDALDALEKEKGIPKEYMLEKIEVALMTAYKKDTDRTNVRIALDPVKRTAKMYCQKTVVEEVTDEKNEIILEAAKKHSKKAKIGDLIEIEIKPKDFGRIPAQTAKMVIIQAIRESERELMIKEYESKRGDIITGIVQIIDPITGNAVLEIGKNQATLVRSEQLRNDKFKVGDSVKVYISEIKKESKGPIVILTRLHPGLIKRMFELEVPEIADGSVLIHSVAREPGSRTKMAVYSRDENVDPIGACIGVKSMRKSKIVKEIRGEKIDIIKYNEDPEEFVKAALAPATCLSVRKVGERFYRVIVSPENLSLAIGKEGQNARLAARLTGMKIDIKPEGFVEPEEGEEDFNEISDEMTVFAPEENDAAAEESAEKSAEEAAIETAESEEE